MNAKQITRTRNGTILMPHDGVTVEARRIGEIEIGHTGREGVIYAPVGAVADLVQAAYDDFDGDGSSAITIDGQTMPFSAYAESLGAIVAEAK